MNIKLPTTLKRLAIATAITAGLSSLAQAEVIIGNDLNSNVGANETLNGFYSSNRGTNGGGDQSLQYGDNLYGTETNDTIIGGLGIDVLFGYEGDDVLIGGTEDFNPFNRDRAFGGYGDDTFIWAPGDGNDAFYGGEGIDVLMIGLIGENTNASGDTEGAPFFGVSLPGTEGSGDFDGIYLTESELPLVDVAGGPGFCELIEKDDTYAASLTELNIDHLVRFVIRNLRNNFIANGDPTADDGLRIAVHLKDVEYLVCGGTEAGTLSVLDLTQVPAQVADVSELPFQAQQLIFDRLGSIE